MYHASLLERQADRQIFSRILLEVFSGQRRRCLSCWPIAREQHLGNVCYCTNHKVPGSSSADTVCSPVNFHVLMKITWWRLRAPAATGWACLCLSHTCLWFCLPQAEKLMRQIGVKNVKLSEYEMSIAAHLVDPLSMQVRSVIYCQICVVSRKAVKGLSGKENTEIWHMLRNQDSDKGRINKTKFDSEAAGWRPELWHLDCRLKTFN